MSDLVEQLGVATYRWSDARIVIRLVGSLDASGRTRPIDEMAQIDPQGGDKVIVLMQDVALVDSAGVDALCYAAAFSRARGASFAIATPSAAVRAILDSAGLARYLGSIDERPESSTRVPNTDATITACIRRGDQ